MRAEGLPEPLIRSFARSYDELAAGARGTLSEREIEPVESVEGAGALRGHAPDRPPRHDDGDAPGEVAAAREGRPQLPRRDRAPDPPPAPRPRRPRAAPPHEQLPHARGLARGAGALPRAGRRPAARLPATQDPPHRGGRPRAGALARGPRARVVPARPRRSLPRARDVRAAGRAPQPRLPLRLRLQRRQSRRAG